MNAGHKTTKFTISIGTEIHDSSILEAKKYLKDKFGNKYDANPHINFLIMAMPDSKEKEVRKVLDEYFLNKKSINIQLGKLHFEEKNRFFSIPVVGDEIMTIHKDLIELLNPIRENHVREKDLLRINEGRTDKEEEQYIYEYGYLRVLNKFTAHVTIGNLLSNFDQENIESITEKLNSILKNVISKKIVVSSIYVNQFEDAETQSNYNQVWEKHYELL